MQGKMLCKMLSIRVRCLTMKHHLLDIIEMSCLPILEFLLSISYVDHVAESTPYLVDYVLMSAFLSIGTFTLNLATRRAVARSIH